MSFKEQYQYTLKKAFFIGTVYCKPTESTAKKLIFETFLFHMQKISSRQKQMNK